jgi:antitoxin ParD1/3/4
MTGEIRDALAGILEFPEAHPIFDPDHRKRNLKKFPYGIIFRIDGEEVVLSRHLHPVGHETGRLDFDKDCQSLYRLAMHISLTPELENAVKAKVQSGLYNNASEVVREALRQSLARESENAWLAREAAIGFAQLEAGQTVMVESKEQFMALVREEP